MTRLFSLFSAMLLAGSLLFVACGGGQSSKDQKPLDVQELTKDQPEVHGDLIADADIQHSNPLNSAWVDAGKTIYELKCQACHKLTEEKLVGPGWKGVTQKRTPAWIMNMITNVDIMLEKDVEAQKLLEQCLVRMPNQNITKDEARQILEYMRHNDGEK